MTIFPKKRANKGDWSQLRSSLSSERDLECRGHSQVWKLGLLVKLPKKGGLSLCKNWRGIVLLTIARKLGAL